jgi:hypothetical protein
VLQCPCTEVSVWRTANRFLDGKAFAKTKTVFSKLKKKFKNSCQPLKNVCPESWASGQKTGVAYT